MLRIKEMREKASVTQQTLSEILNVSRSTIAMWESGISNPTVPRLPDVAAALNCSIDDLFPNPNNSG